MANNELLLDSFLHVCRTRIRFDASFSPPEFRRLQQGYDGDQTRKWFMCMVEDCMYISRGTIEKGLKGFVVRFRQDKAAYRVESILANEELCMALALDSEEQRQHFLSWLIVSYLQTNPFDDEFGEVSCHPIGGRIRLTSGSTLCLLSRYEAKDLGLSLMELAKSLEDGGCVNSVAPDQV